MLKFSSHRSASRIDYLVDGWISGREYREAMQYLQGRLNDGHRDFLVLEVIESFYGMPPHLLIDDLVFRARNASAFKKVAIVTDVTWIRWVVGFISLLVPKKLKLFSKKQKTAAIHWLEN